MGVDAEKIIVIEMLELVDMLINKRYFVWRCIHRQSGSLSGFCKRLAPLLQFLGANLVVKVAQEEPGLAGLVTFLVMMKPRLQPVIQTGPCSLVFGARTAQKHADEI